ncbi:hypothetical protein E1180_21465 [Roseibium denhamense]|uniref:Uncharacterized protein n=1 Tax=Roseibium denhamense TaxID=76305 RepID=A0ABY1NRM0_9HYPH|nr:hypothetical protein [Roseibium denhamense]MTI08074.1 hypothetical protein [Roseibium denhamense]SMP16109.1 hypothetical protein SAMN06265374_1664 [Roseibium denhamense]
MSAQNELTPYFAEIELRTDRALKGIREIRRSPKFHSFPKEPNTFAIRTGGVIAFVFFLALFLG